MSARVSLSDVSGFDGELSIRWLEGAGDDEARLSGRLGDARLEALAAAP